MRTRYLLSVLFLSFIGFYSALFAEDLVITTYYPSPYGSYKELRADDMAVGSAYRTSNYSDGRLIVYDKVGIGTPSPVGKLTITGDSGLGTVSVFEPSNADIAYSGGDDNTFWFRHTGNPGGRTSFVFGSTENLVIANTGNVGIGTINPGFKLDVHATNGAQYSIYGLNQNDTNNPGLVRMMLLEAAPGPNLGTEAGFELWSEKDYGITHVSAVGNYGGNRGNSLVFETNSGSGTNSNQLNLNKNGNVGIGATSPGTALQITRASGGAALTLNNTDNPAYSTILGNDINGGGYLLSSGDLRFSTGSGWNERMRINAAGNVGIGKNNPRAALDIYGTAYLGVWEGGGHDPIGRLTIDQFQQNNWITLHTPDGNIFWDIHNGGSVPEYSDFIIARHESDGHHWNSGALVVTQYLDGENTGRHPGVKVWGDLVTSGAKNFVIDHPAKPGMLLRHACLEGPEVGVYYRGEAKLVNGQAKIKLPDYFEALTREDGRTAQLTAKGSQPFLLSYTDIVNGEFTVYGSKPEGAFSWEIKAVRKDVAPLKVESKKRGN